MNILWIDRSSSRCGYCGKGADPHSKRHEKIMGFTNMFGEPGCGKEFTHVSTSYFGEAAAEATKKVRPDLPFLGFKNVKEDLYVRTPEDT